MQDLKKDEAKPKSSCINCLIITLIIFLIIIGISVWLLWPKNKTSNNQNSPDYAIQKAEIDRERSVSKTFGPFGDTLSTQSEDGTLYTLTVPSGALILPSTIHMSPLKKEPIANYGKPDTGYGIFLDGQFSFIRPAYLTIQPNTKMPTLNTDSKAVEWGRCNIGSRGYDPEICAGLNNIPLAGGIEPGKVVIHASDVNNKIVLNPTIPTNKPGIYNAQVWFKGAYFADNINKDQAQKLTAYMYKGYYDDVNESEALMHLLTLGGDLNQFSDKIDWLKNAKKDYPREIFKEAIIGLAINNNNVYTQRMKDFKTEYEQNLFHTTSFLPWPRYTALLEQLDNPRANLKKTSLFNINPVKAEEGLSGSWPVDLPDFDETPRNDTGGKSDWREDMKKRTCSQMRFYASSDTTKCDKKRWAIETLYNEECPLDEADKEALRNILTKCADECNDPEECEQHGDISNKSGASDSFTISIYRMKAYLETGVDCKTDTKKTLETYGQNFCK